MNKKLSFLIILTCILGCNQPTVDTKSEGDKLMQLSRDWSRSAPQTI